MAKKMAVSEQMTIDLNSSKKSRFKLSERQRKMVYKFRQNPLSLFGLVMAITTILLAIFAPYITPYPSHAGFVTDFKNKNHPPDGVNFFGTDTLGRDVLSRCVFGFRYSLVMAAVVLTLVVPIGSLLGMVAGFYNGTWIDTVIMRITDVFLALPPLILAMAVTTVLEPTLINAMLAICITWWPWYTRLVYGQSTSIRNEFYVQAAEVTGASPIYIIFNEMLPNVLLTILTKATLDIGTVILIGASLSFVGLGAQPPTPDLGSMISQGSKYLPNIWWTTVFPAVCIVLVILAFNLLGDGVRDVFSTEVI